MNKFELACLLNNTDNWFVSNFVYPQHLWRTEESAFWMMSPSLSKPSLFRTLLVSDMQLWYLGRSTETVRNTHTHWFQLILYLLVNENIFWGATSLHVLSSRSTFSLNSTCTETWLMQHGWCNKPACVISNIRKTCIFYCLSGVRTTGLLPRGVNREVGSLSSSKRHSQLSCTLCVKCLSPFPSLCLSGAPGETESP